MMPGIYNAVVVSANLALSEVKKTEHIRIKANVSDSGGGEPAPLWGNIWLSEKCIPAARHALREMGFDFETRDLTDIDRGALVGKKIKVEVAEENYQGSLTMKIVRFGISPSLAKERVVSIQQRLREKKSTTITSPDGPSDFDNLSIPDEDIPGDVP
jgi:hypothetical protein